MTMLTTDMGTLVYNNIQRGIYLKIEFYPHFDGPGRDQPADKVGFTFQDTRNIQSILYRKYDFWYQIWVTY